MTPEKPRTFWNWTLPNFIYDNALYLIAAGCGYVLGVLT